MSEPEACEECGKPATTTFEDGEGSWHVCAACKVEWETEAQAVAPWPPAPSPGPNPASAIAGKWPGDETEAELLAAMRGAPSPGKAGAFEESEENVEAVRAAILDADASWWRSAAHVKYSRDRAWSELIAKAALAWARARSRAAEPTVTRRIENTGARMPRVPAEAVAKALGAAEPKGAGGDLARAVEEAAWRAKALKDAARDTCDCCGGRAYFDYQREVSGPNAAGNYIHKHASGNDLGSSRLCAATSIWSRIAFETRAALDSARTRGGEERGRG